MSWRKHDIVNKYLPAFLALVKKKYFSMDTLYYLYLPILYAFYFFVETKQVCGKVSYNGHGMNEFVPERTCAYISQDDVHLPNLTVRETLEFSARCQGVGPRYG